MKMKNLRKEIVLLLVHLMVPHFIKKMIFSVVGVQAQPFHCCIMTT